MRGKGEGEKRVRDPKGVQRSVLKALHRIARQRRSEEFEASIAAVTEFVDREPKPSLTTVYRACQMLTKEGLIRMSHTGSRRQPFHFSLSTATETSVPRSFDGVAPEAKKIADSIDSLMTSLAERDQAILTLRSENESLRAYRDCVVEVSHKLDSIREPIPA